MRQRENQLGMAYAFEISEPTLSDTPPSARQCLLIFPKEFTNWRPGIQIYEHMGPFRDIIILHAISKQDYITTVRAFFVKTNFSKGKDSIYFQNKKYLRICG